MLSLELLDVPLVVCLLLGHLGVVLVGKLGLIFAVLRAQALDLLGVLLFKQLDLCVALTLHTLLHRIDLLLMALFQGCDLCCVVLLELTNTI